MMQPGRSNLTKGPDVLIGLTASCIYHSHLRFLITPNAFTDTPCLYQEPDLPTVRT